MTKKSRADKSLPPEWSNGLIGITRSVMAIKGAIDGYTKAVDNKLPEGESYNTEASKVSQPIEGFPNGILREGLKNADQLYVRLFVDVFQSNVEQYYFNDKGEDVTHLVTKDFKDNFLPKKYASKKQADAGVEKEIKPREYKAENIIYLQRGDVCFNNLSSDLMAVFDLEIAS
jgi:hypothetical protein